MHKSGVDLNIPSNTLYDFLSENRMTESHTLKWSCCPCAFAVGPESHQQWLPFCQSVSYLQACCIHIALQAQSIRAQGHHSSLSGSEYAVKLHFKPWAPRARPQQTVCGWCCDICSGAGHDKWSAGLGWRRRRWRGSLGSWRSLTKAVFARARWARSCTPLRR